MRGVCLLLSRGFATDRSPHFQCGFSGHLSHAGAGRVPQVLTSQHIHVWHARTSHYQAFRSRPFFFVLLLSGPARAHGQQHKRCNIRFLHLGRSQTLAQLSSKLFRHETVPGRLHCGVVFTPRSKSVGEQ